VCMVSLYRFLLYACRFLSFLRSASLFQQRALGIGKQIPEIPAQRKFVSAMCLGIRHADSEDSCAAQVCFSRVPRPLYFLRSASLFQQSATPTLSQTAQNCGSYSFDARVKILTEKNCYHPYLSIAPKKTLPRPL